MLGLIGSFLYGITALNSVVIAWLFYKSRDGALRIAVILFFVAYAWNLLSRAAFTIAGTDSNPVNLLIIIIPPFLATSYLAHYLCKKYPINNKRKE
jgi:hypothetical protein